MRVNRNVARESGARKPEGVASIQEPPWDFFSACHNCSAGQARSERLVQLARMRPNVFRLLSKQGTGALAVSSSRRAWLRQPLPTTLARRGHERPAPFAFRRFTSARVLSDQISPHPTTTTFEDPARQGLFYHLVPPPTPLSDTRPAFAVSLLADPPPSAESSTILGWLPAETPEEDRDAGLNDFVPNRA